MDEARTLFRALRWLGCTGYNAAVAKRASAILRVFCTVLCVATLLLWGFSDLDWWTQQKKALIDIAPRPTGGFYSVVQLRSPTSSEYTIRCDSGLISLRRFSSVAPVAGPKWNSPEVATFRNRFGKGTWHQLLGFRIASGPTIGTYAGGQTAMVGYSSGIAIPLWFPAGCFGIYPLYFAYRFVRRRKNEARGFDPIMGGSVGAEE